MAAARRRQLSNKKIMKISRVTVFQAKRTSVKALKYCVHCHSPQAKVALNALRRGSGYSCFVMTICQLKSQLPKGRHRSAYYETEPNNGSWEFSSFSSRTHIRTIAARGYSS